MQSSFKHTLKNTSQRLWRVTEYRHYPRGSQVSVAHLPGERAIREVSSWTERMKSTRVKWPLKWNLPNSTREMRYSVQRTLEHQRVSHSRAKAPSSRHLWFFNGPMQSELDTREWSGDWRAISCMNSSAMISPLFFPSTSARCVHGILKRRWRGEF